MKILLSPAKLMDLKDKHSIQDSTIPKFTHKSEELVTFLKKSSLTGLQKILKISPKLTQQNWERFQQWNKNSNQQSIQAVLGYTGEVYRSLNAKELSIDAINYLQQNTFIFSGLYGVLKPLDLITPYRLEMKTSLNINNEKSLYTYWSSLVTNHIKENSAPEEILLNVTSDEYLKTINQKKLNRKIITCKFQTLKNGKLTSVMMHLKAARGLITKYCAENKVETIEEVKKFNYSNYYFLPEQSTESTLLFIKEF